MGLINVIVVAIFLIIALLPGILCRREYCEDINDDDIKATDDLSSNLRGTSGPYTLQ